jgi:hypothetical protein
VQKTSIGNPTDFVAGCLFAAIGVATVATSTAYPMGTSMRAGPGYFPFYLGTAMTLLGLLVIAGSLRRQPKSDTGAPLAPSLVAIGSLIVFLGTLAIVGRQGLTGLDLPILAATAIIWFASRQLFWVLLSVIAFALSLETLGVFLAVVLSLLLVSRAADDISLGDLARILLVLLLLVGLAFSLLLDLSLPLWPRLLQA